jgi:catechol 2,3-dioxygenase-like lactoylglutathione lyase family enzyme
MVPKMTHVAMRVRDSELREAEAFYSRLFGMATCFRETMTDDGWATLPEEEGWEFAERHGLKIGLVMLYNGDFAIDLESRPVPEGRGRYSHAGLQVAGRELDEVRSKAEEMGCSIAFDSPATLVFDDPYDMRWELTTLDYAVPRGLSAGAREGRWAADLVAA